MTSDTQAKQSKHLLRARAIRFALAVIAVCCCTGLTLIAARIGLSKTESEDALTSGSIASADRAVELTPNDADAHFARAAALSLNGEAAESVKEYERAATLRPRDYFLWLSLGSARDEAGDETGAVAAFSEAVRLAPYYAQPHWQLGNVLFRAGRLEEAFKEMRIAARSDAQLLPAFTDLAWATSGGDVTGVESAIQPHDNSAHLALARLFIRKGRTAEALTHFRAAGQIPDNERQALVKDLLSAGRFREAYQVWISVEKSSTEVSPTGVDALLNGGFETGINLDEAAFGWRVPRGLEAIEASLDDSQHKEGAQSLLLEWKGNADASLQPLAQLVQVEPGGRYRLSFSVLTSDVVTGGLPLIVINDASDKGGRRIAESAPLMKATNGWTDYSVEFTTSSDTEAVLISLQRQSCSSSRCPMFGKVWLDNFSLKKL